MRLYLIISLFTLGLVQVWATGYSQVTLRVEKASLEAVFLQIRQQAGVDFIYDASVLEQALPVSLTLDDATVEEALTKALRHQPLTFTRKGNAVIIKKRPSPSLPARTDDHATPLPEGLVLAYTEVRGRVVDSVGQPLAGASVRVLNAEGKRTTLQTTTDRDGYFLLKNVPEDAVLEMTFVGYIAQKVEATANMGTLVLRQVSSGLDEVEVFINTGYQQVSKERLTGAYTLIDNERLSLRQETNILDRLEGLSNSVMFDNDPNRPALTVRGLSSINGPMQPLIIVDNFPYEGDISNINPNTIENIAILKDAAASSIWGARAGNGVIVITTKKGQYNSGIRITGNSTVSVQQKPDLFYLKTMPASDYIDVEAFLFAQGFYNANENSTSRPVLSPVVELLIAQRDGILTEAEVNTRLDGLRRNDLRRDYAAHVYRQAVNQQYALNLSGGTGNASYFFSVGYDHNANALSADMQRFNVDASSQFKLSPRFSIRPRISFSQTNRASGRSGYPLNEDARYPYLQLLDSEGSSMPWYTRRQPFIDTFYADKLLDWRYYPMDDYRYDRSETLNSTVNTGIDMDYTLFKKLSLSVKYNYMKQFVQNLTIREQESFYARDMINRFTQIDPSTGQLTRPVPLGGMLQDAKETISVHNARAQLGYGQHFGKHEVSALLGAEIAQHTTDGDSHNKYGYNPDIISYATNIDYTTRYRMLIGTATQAINPGLSLTALINRNVSAFSNASYTYDGRYVLYASARKDATNYFGVRTNARGIPLWSAGAAWNITEEDFFRQSALDRLRLRVTYGFSGNSDNLRSAVMRINHLGSSSTTGLPYASINQYPNPELKWERVKTTNIALDFATKDSRIEGSVDFYHKVGLDLFGSEIADYTNGTNSAFIERNVAAMTGRGIDLMLRANIGQRAIRYVPELNLNWNTDQITDYYTPLNRIAQYLNAGNRISAMQGKSVYGIIAYRWAGLNPQTGEAQGYLNGEVSTDYNAIAQAPSTIDDLVYVGASRPKLFGNFLQTVSWKQWMIAINVTYKLGYYFMRPTISYYSLVYNGRGHADYALRWQNPGDEHVTSVPAFQYPVSSASNSFYQSAEVLATKGDHIRLQFVNLSYAIGESLLHKTGLQRARLFVNASNLGIVWKANRHDIDPDYIESMPATRQLTFGLNISF